MIVEPHGEPCGCGQRGCLERYCSAAYMARYARELIEKGGTDSSLRRTLEANCRIDASDIHVALNNGDLLAKEVWDRTVFYLALGCVNICRILDPDRILLVGGMSHAGADLLDQLREYFHRLHWSVGPPVTDIAIGELGSQAGVVGAAALAWRTFKPSDE